MVGVLSVQARGNGRYVWACDTPLNMLLHMGLTPLRWGVCQQHLGRVTQFVQKCA